MNSVLIFADTICYTVYGPIPKFQHRRFYHEKAFKNHILIIVVAITGKPRGRRGVRFSANVRVVFRSATELAHGIRFRFVSVILPALADDGVIPLIYTRDPNVNADLLRTLTAGMDSIRVLKKQTLPDGEDKLYHRVSAGIVTTGDKIDVISMLLLCKKYVRLQQRLSIVELSAMAVGATLAVVLAMSGMMVVPSFVLAVWQLAWCGVMIFMSHRTLKSSKDKNKQD